MALFMYIYVNDVEGAAFALYFGEIPNKFFLVSVQLQETLCNQSNFYSTNIPGVPYKRNFAKNFLLNLVVST